MQLLLQAAQRRGHEFGLRRAHTAQLKLVDTLFVCARSIRKLSQPLAQPFAHFAGGFAREGNGQDLLRLRAVEQCAQDARDQHPGLACTSAGFHHNAAQRVAGCAIKLFLRHGLTGLRVGRG